jgi:hypothetical protein
MFYTVSAKSPLFWITRGLDSRRDVTGYHSNFVQLCIFKGASRRLTPLLPLVPGNQIPNPAANLSEHDNHETCLASSQDSEHVNTGACLNFGFLYQRPAETLYISTGNPQPRNGTPPLKCSSIIQSQILGNSPNLRNLS